MKVKIYTTSTCPHCQRTKEFLKENEVDFENIDVAADQEAANEMVEKTGQTSVPAIIVEKDGEKETVIGFDREKLEELLEL